MERIQRMLLNRPRGFPTFPTPFLASGQEIAIAIARVSRCTLMISAFAECSAARGCVVKDIRAIRNLSAVAEASAPRARGSAPPRPRPIGDRWRDE
jgi:hypothetical protein